MKLLRTLELGPVLALEALWERLGITAALQKIIKQHGYQVDYERALFALTANRPAFKLGVWDRWLNRVYLPSCQDLKPDQMYAAMDLFQAHSPAVEEAVFFRTAQLFNLRPPDWAARPRPRKKFWPGRAVSKSSPQICRPRKW